MKKRILSILLTVCVLISMMPAVALAASGSVVVAGTHVTGGGYWKTDATTGKLSVGTPSDYNVRYIPENRTLILNGATIKGEDVTGSDADYYLKTAGIYTNVEDDVTIVLIGDNKVTGGSYNKQEATMGQNIGAIVQTVMSEKYTLTICGSGSLTAIGGDITIATGGTIHSSGIVAQCNLKIESGNITAKSPNRAIFLYGDSSTPLELAINGGKVIAQCTNGTNRLSLFSSGTGGNITVAEGYNISGYATTVNNAAYTFVSGASNSIYQATTDGAVNISFNTTPTYCDATLNTSGIATDGEGAIATASLSQTSGILTGSGGRVFLTVTPKAGYQFDTAPTVTVDTSGEPAAVTATLGSEMTDYDGVSKVYELTGFTADTTVTVSGGSLKVIDVETPNITMQPKSAEYYIGADAAELYVTISSPEAGVGCTYQWYSNTSNSTEGAIAITGATGYTYKPPTSTAGATHYYCEVTFTNNNVTGQKTASTTSSIAKVEVKNYKTVMDTEITGLAVPAAGAEPDTTIDNDTQYTSTVSWVTFQDQQAVSGSFGEDTTYTAVIKLTAKEGYTFTNTSNKFGVTSSSSLSTSIAIDGKTATLRARFPATGKYLTITQNLSTTEVTYTYGAMAEELKVEVKSAAGKNLTYQWYMKDATDTEASGAAISDAINASYTPDTASTMTEGYSNYYWCVITDAAGNSVTSDKAHITVGRQIFPISVEVMGTEVSANDLTEGTTYWKADSGSVTQTGSESDYNISFDNSTNTLTLNGATISYGGNAIVVTGTEQGSEIASANVTIKMVGTNSITTTNNGHGIYLNGKGGVQLDGSGSLSIDADGRGIYTHDQYSKDASGLIMDSGTVAIKAAGDVLHINGPASVFGGQLTITLGLGSTYGIYNTGVFNINGNDTVITINKGAATEFIAFKWADGNAASLSVDDGFVLTGGLVNAATKEIAHTGTDAVVIKMGDGSTHTHKQPTDSNVVWNYNFKYHWVQCTCLQEPAVGGPDDTPLGGYGEHTWGTDGKCITCNAEGLTITGVNLTGAKTYDGTTDIKSKLNDPSNWSLSGIADGDDVTIDATNATATLNSPNVGEAITVTFDGFMLSGADADNYADCVLIQPAPITARLGSMVTQAHLTVSAIGFDKVYDGTSAATVTAIFTGLQNGETLTEDVDYKITANFVKAAETPDANVALLNGAVVNKNIEYRVDLLGTSLSKNYVIVSGQKGTITGNKITKATVPASITDTMIYGYIKGGTSSKVALPELPANGTNTGLGYKSDSFIFAPATNPSATNTAGDNKAITNISLLTGNQLQYTGGLEANVTEAGYIITVPIIGGNNYNDASVKVSLTVGDDPGDDGDSGTQGGGTQGSSGSSGSGSSSAAATDEEVTTGSAVIDGDWINPFTDVKTSKWFYSAVEYMCERGLMNGTGTNTFSPTQPTSRGMIITILYRLEGEPGAASENPFSDVKVGKYYHDAAIWGAENGLVTGYDGKYDPDREISREELGTIIWRYAGYKGIPTDAAGFDLSGFGDSGDISKYAVNAMKWNCEEEIITGRPGGILDPQGEAQRSEVAAMLMRFLEGNEI